MHNGDIRQRNGTVENNKVIKVHLQFIISVAVSTDS